MTEKVRIKSLVEETRIMAVQVASGSGYAANVAGLTTDDETEEDEEAQSPSSDDGLGADTVSMDIGRIYKQTIEILGDTLT